MFLQKLRFYFFSLFRSRLSKLTFIAVLGALFLSLSTIPSQAYFYFDQARDGFEAYSILHGDLIKILGPSTDIPNVFSGSVWYYILALIQTFSGNNFINNAFVLSLFVFLTLPMAWYFSYELFKNKIIASIAVVLYAFSPLFQLSSRWVSNPTFGFILMPFLLFFLFRFLTKQKRIDAFLSAVFLGLLIQANLGNLIFLFLLPIFFVVFKIRIKSLNIPLFLLGLFLNLSTFLIAEIRFSGRGITSIMEFFNKTHSSYVFSLNYPISLATKIYDFLSSSVLPFSESFVFLIIIFVCVFLLTNSKFKKAVRKDYKPLVFLGIWLLNIVIFRLFLTGYSNSWFMFLPSLLALVILSSYFLFYIFKNKYVLFLAVCLIVLGQLLGNYKWLSLSSNIFSSRDKTTYLVEKELIDYTYKASDYKPFSISTITVPLYINTAWDYLYTFYGNKRYKYTPYWDGRDQAGYLGKMTSQKDATEYRYLIIEPQVPEKFIFDETLNEDNTSVLIERKQIGNFIVEKRRSKAKIPQ